MAKTKKVVEEIVTDLAVANCTEYVSIAFDRNGNLYGINKYGELSKYNWNNRSWEPV